MFDCYVKQQLNCTHFHLRIWDQYRNNFLTGVVGQLWIQYVYSKQVYIFVFNYYLLGNGMLQPLSFSDPKDNIG